MSDTLKIAIGVGGLGLVALLVLRGGGGAGGALGGLVGGGGAAPDALGVAPGAAPPVTSAGGQGTGSKILSYGKSTIGTLINPLTPIKLTAQITQASAHYTAAAVTGAVGAVKGVAGSIGSGVSSVFHSIF